jgi:hypothetical protein
LNDGLRRFIFIFSFFLISGYFCHGQSNPGDRIKRGLVENGLENVRVTWLEYCYIITFENQVYRNDVDAIRTSLDVIAANLESPSKVRLILVEKGVPRLTVTTSSKDWKEFRLGGLTAPEMDTLISVSEDTRDAWNIVKQEKPANRTAGKTDLVFYPQFSFENTLLTQLYEIQFNIAPALQVSLWRGSQFTGQVIFPIHNQMGYEGNFIRPGQVVLTQDFKVHRLTVRMAAGNFGANRYGGDLSFRYLLPYENFSLKGNVGYTGFSHFYDHRWIHGSLRSVTGSFSATWFIPRYNVEFEGGIRCYIYGDMGLYGTCTRWFGETAVGFYAMAGEEDFNGGFYFSVPLPFKKRNRHHFFRITIPDHYELIYNGGTEFYYGQTYGIHPGANRVRGFYRADYIKNELLNFKSGKSDDLRVPGSVIQEFFGQNVSD